MKHETCHRGSQTGQHRSSTENARYQSMLAAALSVVPGAGQFYKGHYLEGIGLVLVDLVLGIWLAALLGLAYVGLLVLKTFGISIASVWGILFVPAVLVGLLPILWWAWAAVEAFYEPTLRHRR